MFFSPNYENREVNSLVPKEWDFIYCIDFLVFFNFIALWVG
ncbi:hypothetical protein PAUR_a3427 [Pseudoalteromonas aurantia 208]|uniref:Uncharacterized protein n=1 Tax=Pseudoalteromonas aurantia 208 TaxID=1314867 RepID=A0ABR9E6Q3_9GAMM|nr:hypothetical protein [Pseudoalteromonas aurantia 208]